jgi:hypothetical protein
VKYKTPGGFFIFIKEFLKYRTELYKRSEGIHKTRGVLLSSHTGFLNSSEGFFKTLEGFYSS